MCPHIHNGHTLFCNSENHASILFIKKKPCHTTNQIFLVTNCLHLCVKSLAKFEIFYRELSDPNLTNINIITTSIVFPKLSLQLRVALYIRLISIPTL